MDAPADAAPRAAGAPEPRAPTREELARYPWLAPSALVRPLAEVFAAPPGYHRVEVARGSFGEWLRGLPLRPTGSPVRAFDGRTMHEAGDPHVAAVAELDVGTRDWQQCSDSVIRLHAEWLWSAGRAAEAAYHFTSGEEITWRAYARGVRARWENKRMVFFRGRADSSHASFRRFLDLVFLYGGTRSLAREGHAVPRAEITPGDFLVWPGGSGLGHAVLVLDVAEAPDHRRVALIGQGYTPAQDFHVLSPDEGGPWFPLDGEAIATPFWSPFTWDMLRRF